MRQYRKAVERTHRHCERPTKQSRVASQIASSVARNDERGFTYGAIANPSSHFLVSSISSCLPRLTAP